MRARCAVLLAARALVGAEAALTAFFWANTALAPDGNASRLVVADASLADLQPLLAAAPYASVRLTALLTPPAAGPGR